MKYLYIISLQLKNGHMKVYNVVSTTLAAAVAAAIEKEGLPADTEPHTTQRLAQVDLEV